MIRFKVPYNFEPRNSNIDLKTTELTNISPITSFSPDVLKNQHRLSIAQINSIFGKGTVAESFEEKAQELEIVRVFLEISDILDAEGIFFVPLKGPVLSHKLYNDPTWRYYRDLDILINESETDKVINILKRNGYLSGSPEWPKSAQQQKILMNHANQISLVNPSNNIIIEIHWRLLSVQSVSNEKLAIIISEHIVTTTFAGRSFSTLSNELELLFLVIHGGLHFWRRLKWLVDINAYLSTQKIDWETFAKLAKKLNAERLAGICNAVYTRYFPGGPEFKFHTPAIQSVVRFCYRKIEKEPDLVHNSLKGIIKSQFFTLFAFPGLRFKFIVLRNYLFVKEFFGRNRILSTIPVFYFYCIVRLAINRIKR